MPTGGSGRALAALLLLVAAASLYLVVAAPLVAWYAERQAVLDDRAALLPRVRAAAAALPGLRDEVSELRAAAGTRRTALDGASDAIASANLQSRVEELAATAGATIGSSESLPAEARGAYRRIGIRFVLSGRYENLVNLLARLDDATPPLVLDNLQIHAALRRPGTAQLTALDAALDVYGFRSDTTAPAAAKP